LRLPTSEIKADIDFINKTKKKLFCYFVGVLCIFFLAENLYFELQTNKQTKNLTITLESKIALGVQQKLGLLEQQASLLIALESLSLRPANFSSKHNVALHARSLGPPWSNLPKLNFNCVSRTKLHNLVKKFAPPIENCWNGVTWYPRRVNLAMGFYCTFEPWDS